MKHRLARWMCAPGACALGLLAMWPAWGQTATTAATAVQHNSSYVEANGTAHVGRVVPVPESLSPQAQARLRHPASDAKDEISLAQRRASTDAYTARAEKQWRKICPVTIANDTMAGVRCGV